MTAQLGTTFQLIKLLAPYHIENLLIDFGRIKNAILFTATARKKHGNITANGKNIKIYKEQVAIYLKASSQISTGGNEEDHEKRKWG